MLIEKIVYKNYNVYVMGNITNESSPYYILYIIISRKKGNLHTALFCQIVKINSTSIGTLGMRWISLRTKNTSHIFYCRIELKMKIKGTRLYSDK